MGTTAPVVLLFSLYGNPIEKPKGNELRMDRHESKGWIVLNRVALSSVEIRTHYTVNTPHVCMTQLENFHASSTRKPGKAQPTWNSVEEIIRR